MSEQNHTQIEQHYNNHRLKTGKKKKKKKKHTGGLNVYYCIQIFVLGPGVVLNSNNSSACIAVLNLHLAKIITVHPTFWQLVRKIKKKLSTF